MLTLVPARDTLTIPEGAAAGAASRLAARGALRVIGSTTSDVHAVTAAMAINSAPAASGDVTVERIMGHLLWVGFDSASRCALLARGEDHRSQVGRLYAV